MPRLVGVDIPNDKRILISLTYVFGIGRYTSAQILNKAGIDGSTRTRDISEDELSRLSTAIDAVDTEGQLRRGIAQNINRLKEIGAYRGLRHRKSLPTRGQRTRTNARTRKGPKKVVATKKSIKAMH
jgi:small subunit ribosomal protein S13